MWEQHRRLRASNRRDGLLARSADPDGVAGGAEPHGSAGAVAEEVSEENRFLAKARSARRKTTKKVNPWVGAAWLQDVLNF